METIHGIARLDVIGPGYTTDRGDPATGKPYLRVTLGDQTVCLTLNLAEMIGGAARGASLRWDDQHPPTGPRRG
jgi:hypothetical protein